MTKVEASVISSNEVIHKYKELDGIVTSNKMDKTIVIEVHRRKRHKTYGKVFTITKKIKAHDEQNECQIGDRVKVIECRPVSKDKRWRLFSIIQKKDIDQG